MAGQIVAYVRVSSADQNTDRQMFDGMTVDKTFTDKCSGGTRNRPALTEMLGYVREGDTIVCHSIDRLARDLGDLMHLVQTMTRRGVGVRFMKEGLTFTGEDSPMQDLMMHILGRSRNSSGRSYANVRKKVKLLPVPKARFRAGSLNCHRNRSPSCITALPLTNPKLRLPVTSE